MSNLKENNMEPIINLRYLCFVLGIISLILLLIGRPIANRYEANKEYRMYEFSLKVLSTFAGLAIFFIFVGLMLFPFVELLEVLGRTRNV